MAGQISALSFVVARIPLCGYSGSDANAVKRSQDRTTSLVEKWLDLDAKITDYRKLTVECCEAVMAKNGSVSLAVVDRERFDAIHEAIKGFVEQLATLEAAIVKLDAFGPAMWLVDISSQLNTAANAKSRMEKRLSQLQAEHLIRNPGMSVEKVMQTAEYKKLLPTIEHEIASSVAYIEKMKPVLQQMKSILASVGC